MCVLARMLEKFSRELLTLQLALAKRKGQISKEFSKLQVTSRSVRAQYMQRGYVMIVHVHLRNNMGKSS